MSDKKIKSVVMTIFIVLVTGCVTKGTQVKMNEVAVGMTKHEVIDALGDPNSTSAKDGVEYLVYQLTDGTDGGMAAACAGAGVLTLGFMYVYPQCQVGVEDDFYVRLTNGRVESYGKVGDFDST